VERFARLMLRTAGWRLVDPAHPRDKYVAIFYPHTSNWDFVLGLLAAWGLRVELAFLAKHSLFEGPWGRLFRAVGGIPVHRGAKDNLVQQVVELLERRERVVLAIAPEGTRGKTDRWKSGFYHIALQAKLPVALGFIDARTRTIGIGPLVELTGDPAEDLAVIRAFYADKEGIRQENAGTIALR